MKKILFFLVIGAFTTACNKSDDSSNTSDTPNTPQLPIQNLLQLNPGGTWPGR